MTSLIPEAEASPLARAIDALEEQLFGLTTDLLELQKKIRKGEVDAVKDSARLTTEIRNWLKMALETEQKREERRKEHSGIVNDYAIDFDRARSEIGCRLDRLRARGCPAGIPRRP